MKRNELTTAGHLISGDRFYKASDKAKKAFECGEQRAGATSVTVWSINDQGTRQKASFIAFTERVIFLRNVNDKFAEAIKNATNE